MNSSKFVTLITLRSFVVVGCFFLNLSRSWVTCWLSTGAGDAGCGWWKIVSRKFLACEIMWLAALIYLQEERERERENKETSETNRDIHFGLSIRATSWGLSNFGGWLFHCWSSHFLPRALPVAGPFFFLLLFVYTWIIEITSPLDPKHELNGWRTHQILSLAFFSPLFLFRSASFAHQALGTIWHCQR